MCIVSFWFVIIGFFLNRIREMVLLLWIKKKEEAKNFWKCIVDGREQLEVCTGAYWLIQLKLIPVSMLSEETRSNTTLPWMKC